MNMVSPSVYQFPEIKKITDHVNEKFVKKGNHVKPLHSSDPFPKSAVEKVQAMQGKRKERDILDDKAKLDIAKRIKIKLSDPQIKAAANSLTELSVSQTLSEIALLAQRLNQKCAKFD